MYIIFNPTIPAKIQSQYQFLLRARHFPGFCLRMFRSSRQCGSSSGPPRGWDWARPCRSPWWWRGSRSRGHPYWRRRSRWSSQDTPGCRSSPATINNDILQFLHSLDLVIGHQYLSSDYRPLSGWCPRCGWRHRNHPACNSAFPSPCWCWWWH